MYQSLANCAVRLLAVCVMFTTGRVALGDESLGISVDDVGYAQPSIVRQISQQNERLELTVNTSRILTLDTRIPRFQVNNPELLGVTALSANQIQISAKKPGVTQINLWDENKQIHTVDVMIYGDLRELEVALSSQFPNSSITVRRYSQSLIMTGFVDNPDHVSRIMRLAEDYAPKIIDNLSVGGVQQVLLKVKVYEVSRTKLRQLGVDWAALGNTGNFAASSISGLITGQAGQTVTASGQTFQFGVVNSGDELLVFLNALQQNNVAKILSEPKIVSVSGRPAQFLVGGETPILVPQGLGQTGIEYRPFGTKVDFLPIVLGNGRIRLEVRPEVSDLADDLAVTLGTDRIPGFRVRRADTAVEMQAGQTFALGGLIQTRTDSVNRGLPWLSDIPGIGIPFRSVREEENEIELIFLVTPELVDGLEPHEVPQCLPGMGTMSPSNHELYLGGHVEVPNVCSPCGAANQGQCGPCCGPACNGCSDPSCGYSGELHSIGPVYPAGPMPPAYAPVYAPGEGVMQFEHGYDQSQQHGSPTPVHGELQLPPRPYSEPTPADGANNEGPTLTPRSAQRVAPLPVRSSAPQYVRSPQQSAPPSVAPTPASSGLIGPVGYDVE